MVICVGMAVVRLALGRRVNSYAGAMRVSKRHTAVPITQLWAMGTYFRCAGGSNTSDNRVVPTMWPRGLSASGI